MNEGTLGQAGPQPKRPDTAPARHRLPLRIPSRMALREVVQFPDPRLKKVSEPITEVTDEIRELAQDMIEVMYDEPGIGLAAPQVGASVRMFVIDTEWSDEEVGRNPAVIINPEISDKEGKITWEEGCLSVPDYQATVASPICTYTYNADVGRNIAYNTSTGAVAITVP